MIFSFVLPSTGEYPSGGARVVYEYANELVGRGHQVSITHLPYHTWSGTSPQWRARQLLSYAGRASGFAGTYTPRSWLRVDQRVQLRFVPFLTPVFLPNADVLVATAWQTAEVLCRFPQRCGHKLYLVHDYEHYMVADAPTRRRIGATFQAGLLNVVTSPAGAKMVRACGGEVGGSIPNGIDLAVFKLREPITSARRLGIGFPWRPEPFKGADDALVALQQIHAALSDEVHLWTFGAIDGQSLPPWLQRHNRPQNEALADLYNTSAIFLVPSHYEGWGLPGAEAMACGAALISTDNGGVRAYAEHERTALLVPPRDPTAMAQQLLRLHHDAALRARLAEAGYQTIQQFTWARAAAAIEQLATRAGAA